MSKSPPGRSRLLRPLAAVRRLLDHVTCRAATMATPIERLVCLAARSGSGVPCYGELVETDCLSPGPPHRPRHRTLDLANHRRLAGVTAYVGEKLFDPSPGRPGGTRRCRAPAGQPYRGSGATRRGRSRCRRVPGRSRPWSVRAASDHLTPRHRNRVRPRSSATGFHSSARFRYVGEHHQTSTISSWLGYALG